MTVLGFTGTRNEITSSQKLWMWPQVRNAADPGGQVETR